MCGDAHLPPLPESKDLIAIIHPASTEDLVMQSSTSRPLLSRTNSSSSTTSDMSSASTGSTSPVSICGRLRLSNRTPGSTVSEFSRSDACSELQYGPLSVRIHKFGFPLDFGWENPVLHQFFMNDSRAGVSDGRLDLGIGGDGIVGRTVSIIDSESRVLGEGIIGRV